MLACRTSRCAPLVGLPWPQCRTGSNSPRCDTGGHPRGSRLQRSYDTSDRGGVGDEHHVVCSSSPLLLQFGHTQMNPCLQPHLKAFIVFIFGSALFLPHCPGPVDCFEVWAQISHPFPRTSSHHPHLAGRRYSCVPASFVFVLTSLCS